MTPSPVFVAFLLAASGLAAAPQSERAEAALGAAIRERMGSVVVTLSDVDVTLVPGSPATALLAVPVAGARVGGPVRFALFERASGETNGEARRIGSASASVHVSARHARARRAIARGTELGEEDLLTAEADVGSAPLKPLPLAADLIGARTVRDLRAGEVMVPNLVSSPLLVRSGDRVTVRIVVDGIEASGEAVAVQSGSKGDIIRLANPVSRRSLRGRIVGMREVEVVR
jgi:flagella basal body P-ring formation protein FlgA